MTTNDVIPEGAAALRRGAGSRPGPIAALRRLDLVPLPIYAVFALLIVLPLALVLIQAVVPDLFDPRAPNAALNLGPLLHALGSSHLAATVLNSLELASIGALTSTLLGGAFAFAVGRLELPGRRIIALVPWIVFLTPSYLKALAWVLLMSPGGYLVQLGLISRGFAHDFFSLPGLIFVETLSHFPLAAFVIGSALAGLGSEHEDAARLAGAGAERIFLRITLPLLAPAIALSLIAIFAEGLSDFGMAATIARTARFELLTYGIFAAASDYPVDFPLAGTQALVLLLLVVAVVLADRLLRRRADPRLVSGRSRPARRLDPGPWRWPMTAMVFALAFLAFVLPLAAIVIRAFSRTLGRGLSAANLTTRHVLEVLNPDTIAGGALVHSLAYAALAAVIASGVAVLLAVEVDRSRKVMRPLVLGISLGAVAIPGIVLGFGYILLWNRLPGFRNWPFPHYGDASLLITGYAAAALPYCLIITLAAIGQLAPNLADAARLQGVGRGGRMLRIILPLVFLSIITAFLLTFIRTVFELPISQLLVPLSGSPVPPLVVKLFNHDGDGVASALSVVAMLAAGGCAGLIWFAANRLMPRRSSRPAPGGNP